MKILRSLLLLLLVLSLTLGLFSCKKDVDGEVTDAVETSPTIAPISFLDYDVVRAENMPVSLTDSISELYISLIDLSKEENEYNSDIVVEADSNAKEILIGHTNRPETEQVISQLASGEYAVAVVGNKIVIVGHTENVTYKAVEYFSATYLVEGAIGEVQGDLFYKATADVAVIIENGKSNYTLVSNQSPYQGEAALIEKLSDYVKDKTGVYMPRKSDAYVSSDDATEILFGYVKYKQTTQVKKKLDPGSYEISFVGKKLVVYSWTLEGLQDAVSAFRDMLVYGCHTDAEDKITLVIPIESKVGESFDFYSEVPKEINGITCTRAWNVEDGALLLYWDNAVEEMLTSYASEVEKLGFTKHQSLDNTAVHSITYSKDSTEVHMYYMKRVKQFRVVTQENAVLPLNSYEYEKKCEPAVTQIGIYGSHSEKVYIGMSYLIRLEDGTFFIIDGGHDSEYDADKLYNKMREQIEGIRDDIVISGWLITHGHGDHYGCYRKFFDKYKNNVTVKYFLGNDLTDLEHEHYGHARGFDYSDWASQYPGCKYMKVHTGQQIFFPGVTLTVLNTHEDLIQREDKRNFNDNACTVFDTVINSTGTRFIWLADAQAILASRLVDAYQTDLKCDVMQVAHHGIGGGSIALYQRCDPDKVFWPIGTTQRLDGIRNMTQNVWVLQNTDEYFHYKGDYTVHFDANGPIYPKI